jgi:hypothetical protein
VLLTAWQVTEGQENSSSSLASIILSLSYHTYSLFLPLSYGQTPRGFIYLHCPLHSTNSSSKSEYRISFQPYPHNLISSIRLNPFAFATSTILHLTVPTPFSSLFKALPAPVLLLQPSFYINVKLQQWHTTTTVTFNNTPM